MISRSPLLTRSCRSEQGSRPSAVRGREVSDRAAAQPSLPRGIKWGAVPPAPHRPPQGFYAPRTGRPGPHSHSPNHKEHLMLRFISWLVTGVAAAFLVVSTAAFSLPTIVSLAFAISIGTLILSTGVAYVYRAQTATLAAGLLTALVSGWTIVASLVFSQPTVQNLALASSLAIGGLAIVGITAHELSEERAVEFAVETTEHESRLRTAA